MHPAPSVIFFTVFSGAGFGLLFFLGLDIPAVSGTTALVFYALAYGLAVGGLLASTFHLGNPQRALKAFSQWRTSWLSREGWLAMLTLTIMGLHALAVIFFAIPVAPVGWMGSLLALLTVFATSMIYAQLKTVPRWNQVLSPVYFLIFSLCAGAMLAGQMRLAVWLLVICGIVQVGYWLQGDKQFSVRGHSLATATGLTGGSISQLEPPHTGTNYLLKEMVHVVGRKHAIKLRAIALILLCIFPLVVLLVVDVGHIGAAIALLSHLAGAVVSRWLFFAEAEHVVGLYYDKR